MKEDTAVSTPTIDLSAERTAWEAWRSERTAELRRPHGWLSITGLHWLDADTPLEDGVVEGLPGRWASIEGGVRLRAAAADGIVVDGTADGAPLDGEVTVPTVEGAPGVLVAVGERRVEVLQRSGLHALRVRDPHAPALAAFAGVPVFDFDERFVVPARFTPFEQVRDVVVGAVVEGLTHHQDAVGTVSFEIGGTPASLVVFRGARGAQVQFTDATSGVTTTGTTRSLALPEPDVAGGLVLDFNRTQNLPCAFTDHATCPLPPPENRLRVAIEAGEQDPR